MEREEIRALRVVKMVKSTRPRTGTLQEEVYKNEKSISRLKWKE